MLTQPLKNDLYTVGIKQSAGGGRENKVKENEFAD